MSKYKIHLQLDFDKRPSKWDVRSKLFDLLKDGFTLKQKDKYDREIKQIVDKVLRGSRRRFK